MNKKRKEKIEKVTQVLETCIDDLSSIKVDEDDYRDSVPENLQSSQTYEDSEEWSDALEDAIDSIQSAVESLKEQE